MDAKQALPWVSDHAVLRYLERAHHVPVEAIRRQLATSAAIGIAHEAAVVSLGPVKIVIKDGAVVTCLRSDRKPTRRRATLSRRERHDD